MSIAGRISVPTGRSIFTGALAIRSSSVVFLTERASEAIKLKDSDSEEPKRKDRLMLSIARKNNKES